MSTDLWPALDNLGFFHKGIFHSTYAQCLPRLATCPHGMVGLAFATCQPPFLVPLLGMHIYVYIALVRLSLHSLPIEVDRPHRPSLPILRSVCTLSREFCFHLGCINVCKVHHVVPDRSDSRTSSDITFPCLYIGLHMYHI